MEVRHGKVHETWASPEIAIDFAGWLSLKFSAFVRPIFIQYLKRN
ncbi:MAG: KilA-N domain-containing protein [Tatlockia sp.]|nr:KilA-N domain-containing protein [Tatlockia sp.]